MRPPAEGNVPEISAHPPELATCFFFPFSGILIIEFFSGGREEERGDMRPFLHPRVAHSAWSRQER